VFAAERGMLGPVTITYEITDGKLSVLQTAHLTVLPPTPIVGTETDDLLVGTMCGESIDGRAGDDNIDARGGADVIAGRAGNDHILGGDGDDVVYAGIGNDIVFGGAGADVIFGDSGDDRLFGQSGRDVIFGDAGDDFISGGDDDDTLFGGNGNDVVHGDAGQDVVQGGAGHDWIYGGKGNDVLAGDAGNDTIEGGEGDDAIFDGEGQDVIAGDDGEDRVIAALDRDDDCYDGGMGSDTLDYSHASRAITVSFADGSAAGAEIGADSFSGFERVVSGRGNDTFIIGIAPVIVSGGGGADEFAFLLDPTRHGPVVHVITDFDVGDHIRASNYDLFEEARDEGSDAFATIYVEPGEDDVKPIRYRNERTEQMDRTVVEIDLDGDRSYETTVNLEGLHVLVIVEHAC
jgi:Ca2+-binding RTX toxin-like protein